MLPYNPKLKKPSRDLRKNMTDAEKLLWSKIRYRQLHGFLFHRQKPVGGYIVDFYCRQAKLVIEVDGGQHFSNDGIEYDKVRDDYLRNMELSILRFTNTEVLNNIESVIAIIDRNLS